jgi:hypothetical protein
VFGDPANPVAFFSEEYHKPQRTVNELAFLAAHIVLAGAGYNAMIGGLKVLVWREGTNSLEPLAAEAMKARSQQFTDDLHNIVLKAMRSQ